MRKVEICSACVPLVPVLHLASVLQRDELPATQLLPQHVHAQAPSSHWLLRSPASAMLNFLCLCSGPPEMLALASCLMGRQTSAGQAGQALGRITPQIPMS